MTQGGRARTRERVKERESERDGHVGVDLPSTTCSRKFKWTEHFVLGVWPGPDKRQESNVLQTPIPWKRRILGWLGNIWKRKEVALLEFFVFTTW